MSYWTGAAATLLAARSPIILRWACIFKPKTFAGVVQPVAFWTGVRPITLTLDGNLRTFQPIGDALVIDPIEYRTGTEIGYLGLGLPLTPEGEAFVRDYDTRLAPAELHALIFNPSTKALAGSRRYWKGFVDAVTLSTPAQGGVTRCQIMLVSSARLGTLSTAGKKSDQSQRQRDSADRMRQYGDLGTKPNDPWGTQD